MKSLALGALLLLTPAAWAADSCTAEVQATPGVDETTDEALVKVFRVQASTNVACADVTVDFEATEQLFNGEEIKVTRRGSRRVFDQTITYKANVRIARDSTLKDTDFLVVSCIPCPGR